MKYIMDHWLPTYPGQPDEMVDNVCVNQVLLGKPWEPHVMEAAQLASKAGQLVIEIGASYGLHTRLLAGSNDVLALEPQHAAFQCLVANTVEADHEVICLNVAAYDDHRRMVLSPDQPDPQAAKQPGHPSATFVPNPHAGWHAAPVDQLVRAIYGPLMQPNVCLIKVDAQGADYHALRGCGDTILRCKPAILFEYEAQMAKAHSWEFDDIREWLGELKIPGVLYKLGEDDINFFFDPTDAQQRLDLMVEGSGWEEIVRLG